MNIGEAAAASGVSAKMIRYYEEIGLIPKADRTASNYRTYGMETVHSLRFIRRARELGFPLEETATLLKLWADRSRSSASVKRVAQGHVAALERKIAGLQDMLSTLRHLVHCCDGDERPDCPILNDLAGGERPACHGANDKPEPEGNTP
ncbi:Cu(I)-responsive transcriptional regulator [Rhizobiaceae bacterium BDR2-2]|uniref:Cu(I)-responsive transcriptional regulator n=1 Tax=Ectorhizobium quercum TaxID=2965071 RepID=A0AAE3N4Q2_9HYPH|nr:Cu(I)-responsive transcriptional regulator [Ectorhizobium quercum]MCX8998477.1 Cu(I)-responsive transcriptional regulator [Ectorhizobium quercum]